jgi:hypothetical protein
MLLTADVDCTIFLQIDYLLIVALAEPMFVNDAVDDA